MVAPTVVTCAQHECATRSLAPFDDMSPRMLAGVCGGAREVATYPVQCAADFDVSWSETNMMIAFSIETISDACAVSVHGTGSRLSGGVVLDTGIAGRGRVAMAPPVSVGVVPAIFARLDGRSKRDSTTCFRLATADGQGRGCTNMRDIVRGGLAVPNAETVLGCGMH